MVLGHGSRYDIVKKSLNKAGYEIVHDFPDLIVLANHSHILKREKYENIKYGAINCHAGKLPEYRGSSVLNWQIINGEKYIGWSIIQIDKGIDTGDILECGTIENKGTIKEIRRKIDKIFGDYICGVVERIDKGVITYTKQNELKSCYWHHRIPSDSKISWGNMTAEQICNLVKSSEESYVAFCNNADDIFFRKININQSKLLEEKFNGVVGRVVRKIDGGFVVIAKDEGVWIKTNSVLKIGQQLY